MTDLVHAGRAAPEALNAGAWLPDGGGSGGDRLWRAYADPVGHPLCLIVG